MNVGIIGTNYAGKTILTSLLSKIDYEALATAQRSMKPRSVQAKIPDSRLELLGKHYGSEKKLVFAFLEIWDSKPLDLTSSIRGQNDAILAYIRGMDVIILVVRAYQDNQGNPAPSIQAVRKEIDDIKTELFLADLEILEKRISKLEHQITKPTQDRELHQKELLILKELQGKLVEGSVFQPTKLDEESLKLIRGFSFLNEKPLMLVLNIAETDLNTAKFKEVSEQYPYCLTISLKLEQELVLLPESERKEFMNDYGLNHLVAPQVIKVCYSAANLISFFTIGKDEIKAWSVAKESNAVTAASKVHSDMARGFISAEAINFTDWQEFGSMKNAREHGKVRLEGKNYLVKDGDIIYFKFNV